MKSLNTVLIGSRKGLFVIEQHAVGQWAVSAHHFAGEPVSQTLADPRTGIWYAALRLGHFGVKLHKSADRGKTWQEITSPALPIKPETGYFADDPTPWSVEMIWSLAAGGADQPGRLWAGCMPAALFRSDDGGASWQLCQGLWLDERRKHWMGGGNDYPGMHTVLVDPRNANRVTVAISCGGVWSSPDAGVTWEIAGKGLKAPYVPPELADDPNTQDPHRVSVCAAAPDVMWLQHHEGQYRSVDGGRSWTRLPRNAEVGDFGFAVLAHPRDPRRAWFVPAEADAKRYAPDARMCVLRTDDGGATAQVYRQGLPAGAAYDLIYRHGLAGTADGQTLAMASTTGGLWVSEDAGERWQSVSQNLPPVASVEFVGGLAG